MYKPDFSHEIPLVESVEKQLLLIRIKELEQEVAILRSALATTKEALAERISSSY